MKASYLNREISWLRFNERVLWEAERESLPLLERTKFLAISASNLDEFFMVRVGGLRTLAKMGNRARDLTKQTPRQQLTAIREHVKKHYGEQYRIWDTELEPALAHRGIRRRLVNQLDQASIDSLRRQFEDQLAPLLTPVAVDLEGPNFRIPGLKLCLLCHLGGRRNKSEKRRYVVMPIPTSVPRFVPVSDVDGFNYVMVEDLIVAFADHFFPGEEIHRSSVFRLTRNGDIPLQEDYASDLSNAMEAVLTARKFSDTVRLEVPESTSGKLVQVMRELSACDSDCVYRVPSMLDLSSLMALVGLADFEDLREKPWEPQPCVPLLREESLFDLLREQDVLLHHPYESFEPVVRLVEEAADDPQVVAIKQVLYRTAGDSRIITALIRAAERGKQVVVLIELKARFDEARNLERAEELELAGAQLIYGIKGLKTHAKACLVVRREDGRMRRYMHFGTGNYNESTARLYTDVSYLTARADYGLDAAAFFNGVTGRSQMLGLRKLCPAPFELKKVVLECITKEEEMARSGEAAKIMVKVNSLQDADVIDALYVASQAGVKIQLMVRGICCLRPGVTGLSENIEVHSLVDRYLEHSRVFYFHSNGDPSVFISSADWMERNLEKRIELMIPVEDDRARKRLVQMLEKQFEDNVQAWRLLPDGTYGPAIAGQSKAFRLQSYFQEEAQERTKQAREAAAGVLEMHLPPKKIQAS